MCLPYSAHTCVSAVAYVQFGGPSAQKAMASSKGDVQQLELLTGMTLAQLMTKLTDAVTSGELEKAAAAAAAGQEPVLALPVPEGASATVVGVPATGLADGTPATGLADGTPAPTAAPAAGQMAEGAARVAEAAATPVAQPLLMPAAPALVQLDLQHIASMRQATPAVEKTAQQTATAKPPLLCVPPPPPPMAPEPGTAAPAVAVPQPAAAAYTVVELPEDSLAATAAKPAAASNIVRAEDGTVTIAGHTVDQVREKILNKLAELLGTSPEDIPEHLPLADLGLDSLTAIELVNYSASEVSVSTEHARL